MNETQAQDMSTPEARAAYFEQCWTMAAQAGNEARTLLDVYREFAKRMPVDQVQRFEDGLYCWGPKNLQEAWRKDEPMRTFGQQPQPAPSGGEGV